MSGTNICIIVIPLKHDEETNQQLEIIRQMIQDKANELNCTLEVNELRSPTITIQEPIEQ